MTPEGKVKAAITKVLDSYPESYWFMPVPYGYGESTVDFLVCHYGLFIGIEAKAPGKHPTIRQHQILCQIRGAGGEALVIDSVDACHHLRVFLEQVKQNATSTSKPQAQDGGGAVSRFLGEFISPSEAHELFRHASRPVAASSDGDVPPEKDGVRRAKPDSDAL